MFGQFGDVRLNVRQSALKGSRVGVVQPHPFGTGGQGDGDLRTHEAGADDGAAFESAHEITFPFRTDT
jgi:hypothetical protein